MKFDVVIGNPPYQDSSSSIYNKLNGTKVLRVVDINNPKYVADFTFDRSKVGEN